AYQILECQWTAIQLAPRAGQTARRSSESQQPGRRTAWPLIANHRRPTSRAADPIVDGLGYYSAAIPSQKPAAAPGPRALAAQWVERRYAAHLRRWCEDHCRCVP